MKKRRFFAIVLALCLFFSGLFSPKAAAADGTAGVDIPYGSDVSAYDPDRDGYYGLLPVQYEEAQDAEGLKTMAKADMPVLVHDGHLFVADREMETVLGLTVKKAGSTLLLSAFERHLALGAGNPEAQFFAGDYDNAYLAVTVPLSAAPVYENESVWVPLQDLSILFDLGLHQELDEGEVFLTVYDPDETVVDVLAYLYGHSGACKTAYTSGNLALLGGSSAAAQLSAKLLDGDATAWAALALSSFGLDRQGTELLLRQLADELTTDLLCVIPDESAVAARASCDYISDMLSLVQMETDLGVNAAVDMDLMDAVVEARLSSSSLVSDPKWFSEALDKIQALTEQKKAFQAVTSGADNVMTGVKTVFGMLQTAATYASVDEISRGGVSAICGSREYLTYSDSVVLDEIASYADFMQSGAIQYSLYDYVTKNVGSWVLDGLSGSCPVFKLMQLSTHLVPAISEGLDATASFQASMLAIPLQSDIERILQAELKAYPARRAGETEFRALSETAYIYLKTCYIARNQAASALQLSGEALSAQQAQMELLLEKMSILSVHYGITPENAYDKVYRIQDVDDSVLIENYVQRMVLQVSGAVLREADESPVEDARCEIGSGSAPLCGFFEGTAGGAYSGIFLPLYIPDGYLPHEKGRVLSASLTFTSPTVEGSDTVTAAGAPGAAADPVETAYLGSAVGFAVASPMGVIDGTLYAIDTQYIDAGAGIQPLPVASEGGFSPISFAYYGGQIYFVEKTTGSDDTVDLRLCRCEKDGSGRTILVEGDLSWGILNFVIENNTIVWEQFDFSTATDYYQVYNISEGRLLEGKGIPQPLTKLVFESCGSDSVALLMNGDGTMTLYRCPQNSAGGESLSENLVTVGDDGSISVQYLGGKGYIEHAHRVLAVCGGYAYLSAYAENLGLLYRLNLRDAADIQVVGSHMAAGGGDPFFNY